MKKRTKIILYTVIALCLGLTVTFGIVKPQLLQDPAANNLLAETLSRAGLSAVLICLLILFRQTGLLRFVRFGFARSLLWCVPCFLVAVVNFPFSALITGEATVARAELIPLFLLLCIFIGVSEELLFRAVLHDFIREKLSHTKNGYLFAVLVSAAVFGLWHLVNLLYGAAVGPTFLQAGYSFLIGAMLAVTLDKTHNIWLCVAIHALFDFGGFLVGYLGSGTVHDTAFWILTAVVGVLCAVHIVSAAIRENKKYPLPK